MDKTSKSCQYFHASRLSSFSFNEAASSLTLKSSKFLSCLVYCLPSHSHLKFGWFFFRLKVFEEGIPAACTQSSRRVQATSIHCLTHPLPPGNSYTGWVSFLLLRYLPTQCLGQQKVCIMKRQYVNVLRSLWSPGDVDVLPELTLYLQRLTRWDRPSMTSVPKAQGYQINSYCSCWRQHYLLDAVPEQDSTCFLATWLQAAHLPRFWCNCSHVSTSRPEMSLQQVIGSAKESSLRRAWPCLHFVWPEVWHLIPATTGIKAHRASLSRGSRSQRGNSKCISPIFLRHMAVSETTPAIVSRDLSLALILNCYIYGKTVIMVVEAFLLHDTDKNFIKGAIRFKNRS